MKFGGTSVGSAARMMAACDLIAAPHRPVVAVVSAMSKITDLLLEITRHAEAGDDAGMERGFKQLETRHMEAAAELVPSAELARVQGELGTLVAGFRRIAVGM